MTFLTILNYPDGERFNNCIYRTYGIFFDLTDEPSVGNYYDMLRILILYLEKLFIFYQSNIK